MWKFQNLNSLQRSQTFEVERLCHPKLPENAHMHYFTRFRCLTPFFALAAPESDLIPVEHDSKAEYMQTASAAVTSSLQETLTNQVTWWPRKTRALCLHDCHAFDTVPCPIPEDKDTAKGEWIIAGDGVCCSPNCVKGYLLEHSDHTTPQKLMLLDDFAQEQFGLDGFVEAAPPRTRLKAFNQDPIHGLDIEEFRRYHQQVVSCTKLPNSMIVHAMVFSEEYHDPGRRPLPPDAATNKPLTALSMQDVNAAAAAAAAAAVDSTGSGLDSGFGTSSTSAGVVPNAVIGNHSLPAMFQTFLKEKSNARSAPQEAPVATGLKSKKRKTVDNRLQASSTAQHVDAAAATASPRKKVRFETQDISSASVPTAPVESLRTTAAAASSDPFASVLTLSTWKGKS
jgi:hypothetical protein